MTREEQIRKALGELIPQGAYTERELELASQGFVSGAKWADSHPQQIWHKCDDALPEPEKPVLCYTAKGTYVVARQTEKLLGGKPSGQYHWSRWNAPIIAWMELPTSPKFG